MQRNAKGVSDVRKLFSVSLAGLRGCNTIAECDSLSATCGMGVFDTRCP
jgi:hypothetical protein